MIGVVFHPAPSILALIQASCLNNMSKILPYYTIKTTIEYTYHLYNSN